MKEDTGDIKRGGLPSWIAVAISNIALIIGGAIGYGELKGDVRAQEVSLKREVDALNQRVDRAERIADDDRKEVASKIDGLSHQVGSVQIDLARVCVRLKCKD